MTWKGLSGMGIFLYLNDYTKLECYFVYFETKHRNFTKCLGCFRCLLFLSKPNIPGGFRRHKDKAGSHGNNM